MSLIIIEEDIHQMPVDAIVHPSYRLEHSFSALDAIDRYAIHTYKEYGEPNFLTEAALLHAKKGASYKHRISVVGPDFYQGQITRNVQLLKESYLNVLELVTRHSLKSVAFPLISSGGKHFPKKIAFEVAKHTLETYLKSHSLDIYLVVYDKESVLYAEKYLNDVDAYVDEQYRASTDSTTSQSLEAFPENPSVDFHESFMKIIRDKQIDVLSMYKNAHISKAHYHKLITGKSLPSRRTALLLAVALKLTHEESKSFLGMAGFSFSSTSYFDLIVEYHIQQGIYDLDQVDQILYQYTEETLRKYD